MEYSISIDMSFVPSIYQQCLYSSNSSGSINKSHILQRVWDNCVNLESLLNGTFPIGEISLRMFVVSGNVVINEVIMPSEYKPTHNYMNWYKSVMQTQFVYEPGYLIDQRQRVSSSNA